MRVSCAGKDGNFSRVMVQAEADAWQRVASDRQIWPVQIEREFVGWTTGCGVFVVQQLFDSQKSCSSPKGSLTCHSTYLEMVHLRNMRGKLGESGQTCA